MPTNVTPDYKKAEQAFREATDDRERLECLREMLRTIPKHKGTEHLQADIKTRIKQLTEELAGPKKGGRRSGPSRSPRSWVPTSPSSSPGARRWAGAVVSASRRSISSSP